MANIVGKNSGRFEIKALRAAGHFADISAYNSQRTQST
jgi:hypothetical protein